MGDRILELDDKVKTNSAISAVEYPRVHGFVYDDGEALAVYWGAIYVGHPEHAEPRVDLTIALGQDWSEGSDAGQQLYAQLDVQSPTTGAPTRVSGCEALFTPSLMPSGGSLLTMA
jgi:hypothetical protein